jgi:hypothetical protein
MEGHPEQSVADMESLARRIRAEALVMRRQTQRQARAYVAVGLLLAAYLSWAFVRIAQYIDVDRLASNAGVLTTGKVLDLLNRANMDARKELPEAIHKTEVGLVASVPETAHELMTLLRDKPETGIQAALAPYDQAFLVEADKLPGAAKRISEAATSQGSAERLTAQLLPHIAAQAAVLKESKQAPADLLLLLDRVSVLERSRRLKLNERVERRLIQDAMAPPDAKE